MKLARTDTHKDLSMDSNKVAIIDKIKRWIYMDSIKAKVKRQLQCFNV